MTLILPLSDLHLEFSGGQMTVPPRDEDKDTILILAGDIGIASKEHTYKEFVEDMSMQFKEVILIMGNHEHYHGKFPTTKQKLLDALADCPNVHILEKEARVFDGVAFICASLWTSMSNMDPFVMMDAKAQMNDYKCIRTGPTSEPWKRKLDPKDTVADHLNAVHYIFEEIKVQKEAGNKIVVVTHHGFSLQSIHQIYKNEPLNGAYVSDLDYKILEAEPDLMIHGHTHVSFDYMIGNTRVIVNPRGYAGVEENPDFDPLLTVEV